jgi:hypothetical protein
VAEPVEATFTTTSIKTNVTTTLVETTIKQNPIITLSKVTSTGSVTDYRSVALGGVVEPFGCSVYHLSKPP